MLISGRRDASISNPSGWCFSPGPGTTHLAVMIVYSHHLARPLNLSLRLHLGLLCLVASGQRCIFYTSLRMLRWSAECLASQPSLLSANSGCGGFAGCTCRCFVLFFTTFCLCDSGGGLLSIYPVNIYPPHVCILFRSSRHLLKPEIVEKA